MSPIIEPVLSPIVAITLAFAIGFAIRRGSVCMVDGAYQAVVHGRTHRLRAFVVAAALAGCIILPIVWLAPGRSMLAPSFASPWLAAAGGALFGIGARINGGCQFGTLSRLASGEMGFVLTYVAAVAGALFVFSATPMQVPSPSPLEEFDIIGLLVIVVFAALAIPALRWRYVVSLYRSATNRDRMLSPMAAMLAIGVLGGILYTTAGSWTMASALNRQGAWLIGQSDMADDWKTLAGIAALFAGACVAALRARQFRTRWPNARQAGKALLGGAMMGAGAALVPGGNGTMLLYSMPSASLSAWIAYAVMTAMIVVSFWPMRRRR